jgi:methionyl-tRNA formyltransferase
MGDIDLDGHPEILAIANMRTVKMFKFAGGIDDGELLDQVVIDRNDFEPVSSVLERLERKVLEQFPKTFIRYLDNPWDLRTQKGAPSYYPNRKPSDGLIDFTRPAIEVCDFINAQSEPYPGAFTVRQGNVVKLRAARSEQLQDSLRISYSHNQQKSNLPTLEFTCGDGIRIQADEW